MSQANISFHRVTRVTSAVDRFGPESACKSDHEFSRLCITATDVEGRELEINLFFSDGCEAKIEAA